MDFEEIKSLGELNEGDWLKIGKKGKTPYFEFYQFSKENQFLNRSFEDILNLDGGSLKIFKTNKEEVKDYYDVLRRDYSNKLEEINKILSNL